MCIRGMGLGFQLGLCLVAGSRCRLEGALAALGEGQVAGRRAEGSRQTGEACGGRGRWDGEGGVCQSPGNEEAVRGKSREWSRVIHLGVGGPWFLERPCSQAGL